MDHIFGGGGGGGGGDMDLMRRELTAEDYERLLALDPKKDEGATQGEIDTLPTFAFSATAATSSSSSSSSSSSAVAVGTKRPRPASDSGSASYEVIELDSSPQQEGKAGEYTHITPHANERRVRRRERDGSLSGSRKDRPIEIRDDDEEKGEENTGTTTAAAGAKSAHPKRRLYTYSSGGEDENVQEEEAHAAEGVRPGGGGTGLRDATTGKGKVGGGGPAAAAESPSSDAQSQVQDKAEDDKCCICMAPYEQGEELMRLPCFHCFHSECSRTWLVVKASCPVCNERIDRGYVP